MASASPPVRVVARRFNVAHVRCNLSVHCEDPYSIESRRTALPSHFSPMTKNTTAYMWTRLPVSTARSTLATENDHPISLPEPHCSQSPDSSPSLSAHESTRTVAVCTRSTHDKPTMQLKSLDLYGTPHRKDRSAALSSHSLKEDARRRNGSARVECARPQESHHRHPVTHLRKSRARGVVSGG